MCRRFKGRPVFRLIVSVPAVAVIEIDTLLTHQPDHPAKGCRSEFVRLAIAEKLGRELMLYLPAPPRARDR
jgi:hypothetical protein